MNPNQQNQHGSQLMGMQNQMRAQSQDKTKGAFKTRFD